MKSVMGIMSVICPAVALQKGAWGADEPFRDYFGNVFEADTLGTRIKQVTDGAFDPEKMAKLRNVNHSKASEDEGDDASSYVKGRVSIVTLTTPSRQAFHASLWRCFRGQTHHDKELVVFETYAPEEKLSTFFTKKANVDKEHDLVYAPMLWKKSEQLHVGLKRDVTLFLASGEFLVQFDDGDLYAPSYVSKVLSMFKGNTVAVATTAWHNYNAGGNGTGPSVCFTDATKCPFAKYGADFAYAYKREAVIARPFLDVQAGEDVAFMMRMKYAGEVGHWNDTTGLMVHVLNTSDSSAICCSPNSSKDLSKLDAMQYMQK